ncbi:MAG: hypothetical protein WAT22_06600 [Saprospiraceae bacterium]
MKLVLGGYRFVEGQSAGEEVPINCIWSDVGSHRIGFNMKGYFQIGLTKKGEKK